MVLLSKTYIKSDMVKIGENTNGSSITLEDYISSYNTNSIYYSSQFEGVTIKDRVLNGISKIKSSNSRVGVLTVPPTQSSPMMILYVDNDRIHTTIFSDSVPNYSTNPITESDLVDGDKVSLISSTQYQGYIYNNHAWSPYGSVSTSDYYTKSNDDPLEIINPSIKLDPYTNTYKSVSDGSSYDLRFNKDNSGNRSVSLTYNNQRIISHSSTSPDTVISDFKFTADKVMNAVYNDYAEYFERGEVTEPGDIISLDEDSSKEIYIKSSKNSKVVVGVHSDSYGHIVGGEVPPDDCDFEDYNINRFIPVALSGRVYVKVVGNVSKGDLIIPSDLKGVGEAVSRKFIYDSLSVVGVALDDKRTSDVGKVKIIIK